MNSKITFTKSMLAVGLFTFANVVSATSITFDNSSLGGSNVFDFDSISLLSHSATVVQTDDGDGLLTGSDAFTEVGVTGSVSFNTESGTNQTPLNPLLTGLNSEYQIFFDLTLAGSATFTPIDFDGNPGPDILLGLIDFDATLSSMSFYYDTDMAAGLQLGSATSLGNLQLNPNGFCSSTSFVASGDVTGSCKLTADFDATPGFFSVAGAELTSLLAPIWMSFDINIDSFTPPVEFVYPDGPGSQQIFDVTHDGSARINVPEPSSIAALGLGLLLLGANRRRTK